MNQHIFKCELYTDSFIKPFLKVAINARLDEMIAQAHGGVGLRHITKGKLERLCISLPPKKEQKRIVARVDELMALCDELEERQKKAADKRVKLNDSAINSLLEADTPKAFDKAWQLICDNFDLLYDDPQNVNKLRQAVLQLAVEGKLTTSTDSMRSKSSDSMVGDYVTFLNGYAFKSSWFQDRGIRLVRNKNVGHMTLDWKDTVNISKDRECEFQKWVLSEGDIVISLDRPLISTGLKVAMIRPQDLPCLLLQRVAKAEYISGDLSPAFFMLWLQSPLFTTTIDPGRSKGVPHISTRQVEAISFSPPPLREQKRIVAKVDELMALCDQLEEQLKQSQSKQEKLMTSIVHHLLVA